MQATRLLHFAGRAARHARGLTLRPVRPSSRSIHGAARSCRRRTESRPGLEFERLQPSRCFRIQHQALVLQPEWALKTLCEFLRIPFEEGMVVEALRGPGCVEKLARTDRYGRQDGSANVVPPPAADQFHVIVALDSDKLKYTSISRLLMLNIY